MVQTARPTRKPRRRDHAYARVAGEGGFAVFWLAERPHWFATPAAGFGGAAHRRSHQEHRHGYRHRQSLVIPPFLRLQLILSQGREMKDIMD